MKEYPFANILEPGRRNHSRRRSQWLRWLGILALLLVLVVLALI